MRRHLTALLLALGLGSALGGCATITTGTTQPINFDSDPQQAECTLTREGQTLGKVTTPGPLVIKRHASTIQVVCRKAGYEDGHVIMNSRFETASAGNFLVGGIIGVMVDSSSGASSRYESNVMVRLTPMSPADAAAAAKAAPPSSPPPTPAPPPEPAARGSTGVSLSGLGGGPSTPTEIECVGTEGSRLRVTASACPAPLTRVQ